MYVELEKNEAKSFQFFPLRSSIIPKYILLDTASLVELFFLKNIKDFHNRFKNSQTKTILF